MVPVPTPITSSSCSAHNPPLPRTREGGSDGEPPSRRANRCSAMQMAHKSVGSRPQDVHLFGPPHPTSHQNPEPDGRAEGASWPPSSETASSINWCGQQKRNDNGCSDAKRCASSTGCSPSSKKSISAVARSPLGSWSRSVVAG